MRHFTSLFVPLCLALALSAPVRTYAYNNTSLKWRTISTAHFDVHFHQGAEWTAKEVAEAAEEIYPFITSLYNYEPNGKINFIIKDTDDYANGATYYYDNKIEIWATNLEFGFRGTSKWIQNVVTHEFTHMISIQAGFKMTRHVPALYFQLIDFEKEKRPDVLTGYPSNIVSYPLPGSVIPPWFAEGVAQFQSPLRSYDCWDAHRDMVLRCAVLENKMLSYDEMGFFGHSGMGNEEVYDHGFGFVRYMAVKYGPQALEQIVRSMKSPTRFKFDGALKKVTGKNARDLYADWVESMQSDYNEKASLIEPSLRKGRQAAGEGYMTISPSWSPDGGSIAFLSNKGSDLSGTSLYMMDSGGGKAREIAGGVSSRASFSRDGKKLLYSKKDKANRYGSEVNDLYVYDLDSKKERRLTKKLRSGSPVYSPDGKKIACVLNSDGTNELAVLDAEGSKPRILFNGAKGTQIYSPAYSPDGSRILFGIFTGDSRDIAMIPMDGGEVHYLVQSACDERDVSWIPDGSGVVFSSDRTGIFNIYKMDFDTNVITQLTNVIGGAFMPVLSPNGISLAYSGFTASGYNVSVMDGLSGGVDSIPLSQYESEPPAVDNACITLRSCEHGNNPQAQAADNKLISTPYKRAFTPFQVYPRFVLYDRNPRFGFFMTSNEMLDKQAIYIASSMGTNKEFDAYVSYEARYLYPTLFAEFVRLREKFSDDFEVIRPDLSSELWDLDLTYDLWQFNVGLRLEFEDVYSLTKRNNLSVFFTHGEYSVHIAADVFDSRDKIWSSAGSGAWKYFIGNEITARYQYKNIQRAIDSDINPRSGREVEAFYLRSFDRLFTSGEFEYGFYPDFDKDYYNQYSLQWTEFIKVPSTRHTLQLKLYTAAIDRKVDNFFYIYLGGRDYLRGYTYYSIGGRKALLGSATYRFPLLRNLNRQFLHLYFRDMYGAVFFEAGNAWNEDKIRTFGYKKSIGGEIRLNMGSFYTFPTALSLVSAYALTPIEFSDLVFNERIVTIDKGWTTYLTLGFGF